jgi:hypothetical protein
MGDIMTEVATAERVSKRILQTCLNQPRGSSLYDLPEQGGIDVAIDRRRPEELGVV